MSLQPHRKIDPASLPERYMPSRLSAFTREQNVIPVPDRLKYDDLYKFGSATIHNTYSFDSFGTADPTASQQFL